MVVLLILASIAISFAVNFIFDTFLLNYVRRDIIPKKDIFAIEAIYVSQLINFCFFSTKDTQWIKSHHLRLTQYLPIWEMALFVACFDQR